MNHSCHCRVTHRQVNPPPDLSVCMLDVHENLIASPLMNILIEDAESLQYLTTDGQWTKNATEGRCFEATGAAFEIAKREPIHKFNIVCYISETRQFINMDHGRGKGAETSTA